MATPSILEALDLELIEVELAGKGPDGQPPVIKIRQPSYAEWEASEGGLPMAGLKEETPNGETPTEKKVVQWFRWARQIVPFAVVEIRVPIPKEGGGWNYQWEPMRVVTTRTDRPNEIGIDEFDRRGRNNLVRVWNALIEDLRAGGAFASTKDAAFPGQQDVDAGGDSEDAGVEPARTVEATP